MTAEERAHAFVTALNAGDESAAMAPCTDDGWELEGDSLGDLYEQAQRKGFQLGTGALLAEQGERSAFSCPVVVPGKEGEEERLISSLNLLDDGSGLAGVAQSAQVAHAFVEGQLPAMARFQDLPESEEARAFVLLLVDAFDRRQMEPLAGAASDTLESLRVLRQLAHRIDTDGVSLSVGRSYAVPEAGRYAVEILLDDERRYWILQRAPGGGLQSRMLSTLPSLERLLDPKPLTPRPV